MSVVAVKAGGPALVETKRRYLEAATAMAKKPMEAVRRVWGVVVQKTHLATPVGYVRSGAGWLSDKVAMAGDAVGWLGGIGAVLLAISTSTGRSVLNNIVVKPLKAANKAMGVVVDTVQRGLDHLGWFGVVLNAPIDMVRGAGSWAADKVREFNKDHAAKHLHIDSGLMSATRTAGVLAIGTKIAMAVTNPVAAAVVALSTTIFGLARLTSLGSRAGMFGAEAKENEAIERLTRNAVRDEKAILRAHAKELKKLQKFIENAEDHEEHGTAATQIRKAKKAFAAKWDGIVEEVPAEVTTETVEVVFTPEAKSRRAPGKVTVLETARQKKAKTTKVKADKADKVKAAKQVADDAAVIETMEKSVDDAAAKLETQEAAGEQPTSADLVEASMEAHTEILEAAGEPALTDEEMAKATKAATEIADKVIAEKNQAAFDEAMDVSTPVNRTHRRAKSKTARK